MSPKQDNRSTTSRSSTLSSFSPVSSSTSPSPKHLVHFYRAYANRVRQTYRPEVETDPPGTEGQAVEATPKRTLSKRWRDLIHRIFEVDPR